MGVFVCSQDLTASPVLFEALTVSDGEEPLTRNRKRERWRPLYDSVESSKVDEQLWADFLSELQQFEAAIGVPNSPKKLAMRLRASTGGGGGGGSDGRDGSPERAAKIEAEAMAVSRARGRRDGVTLEWAGVGPTRAEAEEMAAEGEEEDGVAALAPVFSAVAADARRQFSKGTTSAKALLDASSAVAAAASSTVVGAAAGAAGAASGVAGGGGGGGSGSGSGSGVSAGGGRLGGRLAGRLSGARRGHTQKQPEPEPEPQPEPEPEPEPPALGRLQQEEDEDEQEQRQRAAAEEGEPPPATSPAVASPRNLLDEYVVIASEGVPPAGGQL